MHKLPRIIVPIIVLLGFSATVAVAYFSQNTQAPTNSSASGFGQCLNYTYTDWTSCLNGKQSRQVAKSQPPGCTGGNPQLTQSCTICTDFTYSDWSGCENGTQIRTVHSSAPSNCTGGVPLLSQTCNRAPFAFYRMMDPAKKNVYVTSIDTRTRYLEAGYTDLGIMGYLASEKTDSNTAFYHLVNDQTGDNYYTANTFERDNLLAGAYRLDTIIGYISTNPDAKNRPLYNLYNGSTQDRIYTTSESEKTTLTSKGYMVLGISGYLQISN